MSSRESVSRRQFLLGRLRKPASEAVGEAIPGPGCLRGTQRQLPADLLSLGEQDPGMVQPRIYDIVLQEAMLDALLRDIQDNATELCVLLKGATQQASREAQPDLRKARRAILRGEGVQLRYRHQGVLWSDTVRRTQQGTTLTRCQLPPQFGS